MSFTKMSALYVYCYVCLQVYYGVISVFYYVIMLCILCFDI